MGMTGEKTEEKLEAQIKAVDMVHTPHHDCVSCNGRC
jgi:hypothetical protein